MLTKRSSKTRGKGTRMGPNRDLGGGGTVGWVWHSITRSSHASLPHRRDGQRVLSVQSQQRHSQASWQAARGRTQARRRRVLNVNHSTERTMRGKSSKTIRARPAPQLIPASQAPSSGKLNHSWSHNDQLSAPGQNSLGANSLIRRGSWKRHQELVDGRSIHNCCL